jgi:hypothetical protein
MNTNIKTLIDQTKKQLLNVWQRSLKSYKSHDNSLNVDEALGYIKEFENIWFDSLEQLILNIESYSEYKDELLSMEKKLKIFIGDCESFLPSISVSQLVQLQNYVQSLWEESFKFRDNNQVLPDQKAVEYFRKVDLIMSNEVEISCRSKDPLIKSEGLKLEQLCGIAKSAFEKDFVYDTSTLNQYINKYLNN